MATAAVRPTLPATVAPSPSARAEGTDGVHAHVAARRPTVAATTTLTVPKPSSAHSVSATVCSPMTRTSATTPNAPTSG